MVVAFLMRSPLYVKNRTTGFGGNYNGYVAFKEELPLTYQSAGTWFSNNGVLDDLIKIRSEITFDTKSLCKETAIIPLTAIPEDIHEYRVIGFDTAHFGDTAEYWTFERTKEETLNLKKQIEDLIAKRHE